MRIIIMLRITIHNNNKHHEHNRIRTLLPSLSPPCSLSTYLMSNHRHPIRVHKHKSVQCNDHAEEQKRRLPRGVVFHNSDVNKFQAHIARLYYTHHNDRHHRNIRHDQNRWSYNELREKEKNHEKTQITKKEVKKEGRKEKNRCRGMKQNQVRKEQRRKKEGARTKERTKNMKEIHTIQMHEGRNDPSPCLDVVLTSLTAFSSKASIAHTLARLAITMSANSSS